MPDARITAALILLATAFVAGCAVLALLLPRLRRLRRLRRADEAALDAVEGVEWPAVSVIVTAIDDARALPELLPRLLTQDYPGAMEVIVVSGGDSALTEETVQRLQNRFTNLYMTFAPQQSRSVSRRKLALTIGVKAAAYDALLFTDANCRIASPLWLRAMARHFAAGAEVVCGTSVLADLGGRRPSRALSFDRERTKMQYLAAAAAGKMYRADGRNMGYLKSLFMEHKGFSETLCMVAGDDDVFVDTISRGHRCAVELSAASRVEALVPSASYEHLREKASRSFTSKRLRRGTFRLWGLMTLLWWTLWVCGLGAAAVALPWGCFAGGPDVWLPAAMCCGAAAAAIAVVCVPVMTSWRKTARAMGCRPLCLTVPWLMLWHPFYNELCRLRGRSLTSDYTWETL